MDNIQYLPKSMSDPDFESPAVQFCIPNCLTLSYNIMILMYICNTERNTKYVSLITRQRISRVYMRTLIKLNSKKIPVNAFPTKMKVISRPHVFPKPGIFRSRYFLTLHSLLKKKRKKKYAEQSCH